MSLFRKVLATRYPVGMMWLPNLSLDLLSRDWAAFTEPWDFNVTQQSVTPTNAGSFVDWFDTEVFLPTSWAIDEQFATLQLRLRFGLEAQINFSGDQFYFRPKYLTHTGTEFLVAGTTGYIYRYPLDLVITGSALPSGRITVTWQIKGNTTQPCRVRRIFGVQGADSFAIIERA